LESLFNFPLIVSLNFLLSFSNPLSFDSITVFLGEFNLVGFTLGILRGTNDGKR